MPNKNDYVIETFTGNGEQPYYWRIRHKNGNIVQSGEGYVSAATRDEVAQNFSEATGLMVKNADANSEQ